MKGLVFLKPIENVIVEIKDLKDFRDPLSTLVIHTHCENITSDVTKSCGTLSSKPIIRFTNYTLIPWLSLPLRIPTPFPQSLQQMTLNDPDTHKRRTSKLHPR